MSSPRISNRVVVNAPRRDVNRTVVGSRGYAVPRGSVGPRYVAPRYVGPRRVAPRYVAPRYVAPRYGYAGPRYVAPHYRPYYRPYRYYAPAYVYRPYVFRPHFSVGFGFFAGYAVPYTWSYPVYAPAYGYAPTVAVTPGPATYGGVSFEVSPVDAEVFVDGNYAGTVSMFDGTKQPMTLAAGQHTIELRSPGCQSVVFSVDVQPGQVIPYRGALEPIQ